MSRERIRQDVATAVDALVDTYNLTANPPLVVEYDNRIVVDTTKQVEPFMCVSLQFNDAYQPELQQKLHRFMGFIKLSVASKEGSGTAKANAILDYFYPKLHATRHGTVRTLMADVVPDKPHLGWIYQTMVIPFWSDQPNG